MKTFIGFIIVFCIALTGVQAQNTTTWTGAVSTDWNTAGNWNNGVPTASSDVTVDPDVGNVVVIDQDVTINSLSVESNTGTLTLTNGAKLTIAGDMTTGYPGTINLGNGEIAVGGNLDNGMSINVDTGKLTVGGTASSAASSELNLGSGSAEFMGGLSIGGSNVLLPGTSTVTLDGTFAISADSDLDLVFYEVKVPSGADVEFQGPLIVLHNLEVDGHLWSQTGGSKNSALDVVGRVKGVENIDTSYPFVYKIVMVDDTHMTLYFNEPVYVRDHSWKKSSANDASYYKIINNIDAAFNDPADVSFTSASVSANQKSVTLTASSSIPTGAGHYLYIAGNGHSSGTWIRGVTSDSGNNPVSDPYRIELWINNLVVWTGATSTAWGTGANWSDGVVPAYRIIDLYFSGTASNDLYLPADVEVGNIHNPSAKNLRLKGHNLTITDKEVSFSGGGTIWSNVSGSKVTMQGTSKQTLSGNVFKNNTLANLAIDNGASGTAVNLSGKLSIGSSLDLVDGTLKTHNKLTLLSRSPSNGGTACVLPVQNGAISGMVTVERYMSANRSYRYVSSPVTTTSSINANWQEGVHNTSLDYSNNKNPRPGYGTHISGSTTGANGLDATQTGNYSLFTFDNVNQTFDPVTNTLTSRIKAGTPYVFEVRGSRAVDLSSPNTQQETSETVIETKGELFIGDTIFDSNMNNGTDYFNLIGNPYQSKVSVFDVFDNPATNRVNTHHYYVYDPHQGDYGGYVAVILSNGNGTNVLNSDADEYLQPFQAAMFQVVSGSGNFAMQFKESDKSCTHDRAVFSEDNSPVASNPHIIGQLYTTESYDTLGPVYAGFGILLGADYDSAIQPDDAPMAFNFGENLGMVIDGGYYSIEFRQPFAEVGEQVQLYTGGYGHQDYTLLFKLHDITSQVFLKDLKPAGHC